MSEPKFRRVLGESDVRVDLPPTTGGPILHSTVAAIPRHIRLFRLTATHRYGRTYEVTESDVTHIAHDLDGRWSVAIHDAASLACLAVGYGETLPEAEAECLQRLRRDGRRLLKTADEIEGRERSAA